MCDKWVLAFWIAGLLVVANHHAAANGAFSAHQEPGEQFSTFVGLLAASMKPAVVAYHDISNYTATLPVPLLRNGIVYSGDNRRLRRVVHNMLHGEPTSIGVIGGSVSYGYGLHRDSIDWFSRLTAYLHRAFPKTSIKAKNGCVPAANSQFISVCLEKFLSHDADLIFVEFATSDGYLDTSINNPYVHAFERLIRRLLNLPKRPAVVLLNYLHRGAIVPGSLFYHTIEDHYGVLAQYYQLPWLSVRDAVWLGVQNGWEGFRAQDMFLTSDLHPWLPNELGHKYIADLAVGLIQQIYLEQMLLPLSTRDTSDSEDIPRPMFPHNYEDNRAACAIGIELQAAVAPDHPGWVLANDGSKLKPRWGYVSYTPGSILVLKLDTREVTSQHIPQHHGMAAAAIQLQDRLAGAFTSNSVGTEAAAAGNTAGGVDPPSISAAAELDGLQAALQESFRQAAVVAQAMQAGQPVAYAGRERVVDGHRSDIELPADARKVAGPRTATGVEVVMNNGRKVLVAAAAVVLDSGLQSDGVEVAAHNISSDSSWTMFKQHSSSTRVLLRASNPNAEAPPADAVYLKPASGSTLSAPGGTLNSAAQADMIVRIGYRKSHRMMGQARIYCIAGCTCQELTVDAWHAEKTSRLAMAKLRVTQHEQCEIGVQVLGQTSSGHVKFKLISVMVSKAVEYSTAGVHAEAALLAALEEASHVGAR